VTLLGCGESFLLVFYAGSGCTTGTQLLFCNHAGGILDRAGRYGPAVSVVR
jgi:hypothetical protein